ncbi:MAG: homocysteine S-methyltransferase family protein [Oceanidesulfovibrio sp.]
MSLFTTFRDSQGVVVLDGAMGTMFQARGLPSGVSPELFGQERPDITASIHQAYVDAGACGLTTNTFGGTRFKLPFNVDVAAVNRGQVRVAREVADKAGRPVMVMGSVGPTGKFVKPLGELDFGELVAAYEEQIRALAEGGADIIVAETHFDLAEVRAVSVAARGVCDLPLCLSMTFEQGVSLTGTPPLTFIDTAQNLGADAVMVNCSAGPAQLGALAEAMAPRLSIPLVLRPNAGLPVLEDGETVFKMGPAEYAEQMVKLPKAGAKFLGGCCGTSPEYIAAVARAVEDVQPEQPDSQWSGVVVTSRAASVPIFAGGPFALIGERINPTGKKALTEELQRGEFSQAMTYAKEQLAAGAPILDVNVGAPMVDESALLPELVLRLVERHTAPLCLDSSSPEALEAGLAVYPGSALVNSISGEEGRMEQLGPLCKRYGAPFILLPLKGKKLPVAAADRIAILEELLAQAEELGIPRRLIMVDALALAVSSKPEAARECLETIRYITHTLGLPTTLGLSNTSFGLPARELVNTTFLAMAMSAGLSSAIAHPGAPGFSEAIASAEVLLGRDRKAANFIENYSDWKPGTAQAPAAGAKKRPALEGLPDGELEMAVIQGEKEAVVKLVTEALENGEKPFAIVNGKLIPAITAVGDLYERKEYFLPQLLLAAEAMQAGFGVVKPLLEEDAEAEVKPVFIMATVEGDIHDIGKNIVCLMLSNHGFDVVDLGKDVPAGTIVEEAKKRNAAIIGLSALMTTTMVRMQDTVDMVKAQGLSTKVMLGGAVVTREFADAIGADGYADDAVGAVREAKKLLGARQES